MVSRPARSDVQRKLVAAADKIFTEHGYEGASLKMISDEAGFTKGAVYSNFASKPELYAAVCATRVEAFFESLHAELMAALDEATDGDVARALSGVLVQGVLALPAEQSLFTELRALAAREPEVRPTYTRLLATWTGRVADALAQHPATGHLPAHQLRRAVLGGLALLGTFARDRVAAPEIFSIEDVAEIIGLSMRGLLS